MSAPQVQVTTQDYVTTVCINRPEKRNALTYALLRDLTALLAELADDPGTRVVVLRGAGERSFSAGLDLQEVLAGVATSPAAPLDQATIQSAMQAVEQHPNPIIAMINGDALAGGCELALHCDFRIMVETARIGMPLVKRGLTIPFHLTHKLVQMVGPSTTTEILVRGAPLSAARAHQVGLVHEVVPAAQLVAATTALATELAANAPLAVRAFKQCIALAVRHDAEEHQQAMNDVMVQVMTSADAREGLQAFLEKRLPQYRGH
jgi:enoyl-CoA hydratase/carnithine racemase